MRNAKPVLAFLKVEGGSLHPLAPEVIAAGRRTARESGGALFLAVVGSSIAAAAEEARSYGAERVFTVDDPRLDIYRGEYFSAALKQVCALTGPSIVVIANTVDGVDLAPRLACLLEAGLVTDCVDVASENGVLSFIKPIYSGNVMAVYTAATDYFIITIRRRSFEALPKGSPAGEIMPVAVDLDAVACMVNHVGQRIEEEAGIKIDAADRIVAGGRGIGKAEGFEQVRSLAETLGAAVGASRPPCDLGWASPKSQVGQTGQIVAPSLYIAIGISGSTQHLAGMLGSKTIVAINKDPQASIFKVANYGIVGNYEEIVPGLTETLQGMMK